MPVYKIARHPNFTACIAHLILLLKPEQKPIWPEKSWVNLFMREGCNEAHGCLTSEVPSLAS